MQQSSYAPYEPRCGTRSRSSVAVRPATADDVEHIARIAHEREGGARERHHAAMAAELERPAGRWSLLAALRDGVVAGFGRAGRFDPPDPAPERTAPAGWYLLGLVVDPAHRRCGVGLALTRARLDWIARRANVAYYFANPANRASVDLHRTLGFSELTRDFRFPGMSFTGGVGVLYHARLRPATPERRDRSSP